jgi:hypothetical protein
LPLGVQDTHSDKSPAWEFTIYSGSKPFKCLKRGRNVQAAQSEAMIELAYQFHDFDPDNARVTQAVQVS